MNVIMLDYKMCFSLDSIKRLVDAGVRTILTFGRWHENEIAPGKYRFDQLLEYNCMCKKAGVNLLVQTPVGVPSWADKSWFLRKNNGETNFYCGKKNQAIDYRFVSYWNSEAMECVYRYISKIRETIEPEGAVCISSIGSVGEFMFPFSFHESYEPWWFDKNAVKSRGDEDPKKWFVRERSRIVKEWLSHYKEKWLQFPAEYANWDTGNYGIDKVFEENKEGLNTIIYSAFAERKNKRFMYDTALERAKKYPTWCGAEGCKNVAKNTIKALNMGMKGTICGPFFYGHSCFEDWMFQEIKKANSFTRKIFL